MEEFLIGRADGIYRWNAAKPGHSLWSAKLGSLLLSNRRLMFLSSGKNDATKRLLGAAAGGQRRADRVASNEAANTATLDAYAFENEGSLSIELPELHRYEYVKKTFSQWLLIEFTDAQGAAGTSSFKMEDAFIDWPAWVEAIAAATSAATRPHPSPAGHSEACAVCGSAIGTETYTTVDGRPVHLRCSALAGKV